ncbi:MAG: hypothetical protein HKN84_08740, partial [Gammaproteobacteria bacterium]|nr:hypothetical protein [Gammaproteobacteria bacterium]
MLRFRPASLKDCFTIIGSSVLPALFTAVSFTLMSPAIAQDGPSWQWPESQWREAVDRVRAGDRLLPAEWPGGALVAVALSFDMD